jgi:predicted RNase H-like HicB family nuclease
MNMHRFLIVIENAGKNLSAYSPDLPGCVATGKTREETEKNMYEAIQMHLEGLREDGLPIPVSQSVAEYLVVGASLNSALPPSTAAPWFRECGTVSRAVVAAERQPVGQTQITVSVNRPRVRVRGGLRLQQAMIERGDQR